MNNAQVNATKELEKGFSTQVGENVGYEKGAKLVKNYHDQNDEQITESFIGRDMIEAILAQPGVVGVNVISGADANGQLKPVLVGVDAQGNYLVNVTSVNASGELEKQKGIVAVGVLSPGGIGTTGW